MSETTNTETRTIKCTKCHGKGRIPNRRQDNGRCWTCEATGFLTPTQRAQITAHNARFKAEQVQVQRLVRFAASIERSHPLVANGLNTYTTLLGAAMVDLLNGADVHADAALIFNQVRDRTGHDLVAFTLAG